MFLAKAMGSVKEGKSVVQCVQLIQEAVLATVDIDLRQVKHGGVCVCRERREGTSCSPYHDCTQDSLDMLQAKHDVVAVVVADIARYKAAAAAALAARGDGKEGDEKEDREDDEEVDEDGAGEGKEADNGTTAAAKAQLASKASVADQVCVSAVCLRVGPADACGCVCVGAGLGRAPQPSTAAGEAT